MEDKATAMKIEKLREQAKDKTIPQEARNQLLDKANMLEQDMAKKAGVKLAKGGMAKAPAKKAMAKGGAVAKKAPTKLAKGGMAKKKC